MIKGKRGQFYLIAAVIIIGILLGFTAATNDIEKGNIDKSKLYSLFAEVNLDKTSVLVPDLYYIKGRLDILTDVYPEIDKIYIVIKKVDEITLLYNENKEIELLGEPLDYNFNLEDNSYVLVIYEGENQYVAKG